MASPWKKMALENNLEMARDAMPRQTENLAKDRYGLKRDFYTGMQKPENSEAIEEMLSGDGEGSNLSQRQAVESDMLNEFMQKRAASKKPPNEIQNGAWQALKNALGGS